MTCPCCGHEEGNNGEAIFTPEEWKIMENYLIVRFQNLIKRSVKRTATEKAHALIQEIKILPIIFPDRIEAVLEFRINFTIQEMIDEFRRNPSGAV